MKSLDLERLWRWLPTFRVVAECQSITEAARLLRLSASSVSRSVRLLEGELGKPLFVRSSGGLVLNHFGREFLEAVRRSMRIVDDGADSVRGGDGVLRLAAPRALLVRIMPALARFSQTNAVRSLFIREGGSPKDVAAGVTDLLLTVGIVNAESVEAQLLGNVELAAFIAPAHRIARENVSANAIVSEHAWIAAPNDFPDLSGWPVHLRRSISVELTDCIMVRDACVHGLGPALLPRCLAAPQVAEGRLREITELAFPPLGVHGIRRPRLAADRAETLIEHLASVFDQATGGPGLN